MSLFPIYLIIDEEFNCFPTSPRNVVYNLLSGSRISSEKFVSRNTAAPQAASSLVSFPIHVSAWIPSAGRWMELVDALSRSVDSWSLSGEF